MKKTNKKLMFLTALIAAAVSCLLAAACEDLVAPKADGYGLNPDGTVTLAIRTTESSQSRAMSTPIAKNAVNCYEAVFLDGTNYSRVLWYKGQTPKITLNPGDYSKKALILAGTDNVSSSDERILLAVGYLSGISADGVTFTNGTAITTSTKSIQFTIFGIDAAPSTIGAGAGVSSFLITEPAPYASPNPIPSVDIALSTNLSKVFKVPLFELPAGSSAVKAKYTIPLLKDKTKGYVNSGGSEDQLGDYLLLNKGGGSAAGALYSVGLSTTNGDLPVTLVEASTKITNAHNSNLGSGEITMDMGTGAGDGLSTLFFNVQVSGLTTASGAPVWNLRGGLNNFSLDHIEGNSTTANTLGGGILLLVGALKNGGSGGIVINPVTP
jgi:hypothetical protein